HYAGAPLHLHSFPTRRSSDLKTVFGAEIRNQVVLADPGSLVRLRPLLDVGVELGHDLAIRTDEILIVRGVIEDRLVDAAQKQLRIVVRSTPQRLVEPAEQPARCRMPAEPEVRRELLEACDRLGQTRVDLQREDHVFHGGSIHARAGVRALGLGKRAPTRHARRSSWSRRARTAAKGSTEAAANDMKTTRGPCPARLGNAA